MNLDRRVLIGALAGVAAAPALAQAASVADKPKTTEPPLARRLAGYAGSLRTADLDSATVERAKVHLLDSLGCGLAAFKEGPVSTVRELALAGGGNAATIIGTARRATLEWAAFANGAAIRADDINDVYVGRGTGHPSDNIAACLAAAEGAGASGAE
jgi:2-methylcitrate dehydratase